MNRQNNFAYMRTTFHTAVCRHGFCHLKCTIHNWRNFPRRRGDIEKSAALQRLLLDRAATATASDGILVYCVCSLEPTEVGKDHQDLTKVFIMSLQYLMM